MSKISEAAARQNDRDSKIAAAIEGIRGDIAKIQSTSGEVTPEDQAILDSMEAKADALVKTLEALDAERG